jgi:hypothetical protein
MFIRTLAVVAKSENQYGIYGQDCYSLFFSRILPVKNRKKTRPSLVE